MHSALTGRCNFFSDYKCCIVKLVCVCVIHVCSKTSEIHLMTTGRTCFVLHIVMSSEFYHVVFLKAIINVQDWNATGIVLFSVKSEIDQYLPEATTSPKFTIRRKEENPDTKQDLQLPLFGSTSKDESKLLHKPACFPLHKRKTNRNNCIKVKTFWL